MSNQTVGSSFKCGSGVDRFHTQYVAMHGWASLLVCIFGSIANGLNVVVLTRREMSSPTNAILTGLAFADLLVMIEYIPYAVHSYLYHRPKRETYTYAWTVFVLFHSNFAQVFHTISIWLTITLAVWRYVAIAYPQKNREWCNYNRAVMAIVAAYLICPLICCPLYLTTEITSKNVTLDAMDRQINLTYQNATYQNGSRMETTNATLYFVALTQNAKEGLKDVNFWIYSVVIKLLPCVVLTFLSLRLILALIEAKNRRKKLTTQSVLVKMDDNLNVPEISAYPAGAPSPVFTKKRRKRSNKYSDKERQTDRTTKMLLAVLLLFLLTEFPQGTLGLLSVMLGDEFFTTCYVKLGEAMDILALINSAINFILYCAMSRQFRTTFNTLFCRWSLFSRLLGRWTPVPQQNNNNGNGNTQTNNHTVTQVTQV